METPLQRTLRKRRAAERDALSPLGPPVTRLAWRATREPGHGKPRAGLRRWWLDRRAASADFQNQALRAFKSNDTGPGRHRAGQCLTAAPG